MTASDLTKHPAVLYINDGHYTVINLDTDRFRDVRNVAGRWCSEMIRETQPTVVGRGWHDDLQSALASALRQVGVA
jgi:hypothetical protein